MQEPKYKVGDEVWFWDPIDIPKEIVGTRIAEVHYSLIEEVYSYELVDYVHQSISTVLFPEVNLYSTLLKAKNAYDGYPVEELIGSGETWYNKDWQDIRPANSPKIFLIRMPQVSEGGLFETHWKYAVGAEGEFSIAIYYNPTYTDLGTPMRVWNTHGGGPQTGYYSQLFEDPVITDNGVLIYRDIMGSGRDNDIGYRLFGDFFLEQNSIYTMVVTKEGPPRPTWFAWEWKWTEDLLSGRIIPWTTTTTTT